MSPMTATLPSPQIALLLAMSYLGSGAKAEENRRVCITGQIMDWYCIDRGNLLDAPQFETLESPEEHSVHCLIDVPPCYKSPFEVLAKNTNASKAQKKYCRAFRLDTNGREKAMALGRATGSKDHGCSTCSKETGGQAKGFRATIKGVVLPKLDGDDGPETIEVDSVEDASVECSDTTIDWCNAVPEVGEVPVNGAVLAHGALMLSSWGFLLPLGVLIAKFQRHRDPLWFLIHRGVQSTGLLLAIIGVSIAFFNFDAWAVGGTSATHATAGTIVMLLGVLQPVNAFFRPHATEPGAEVTQGRRTWELLHKGVGYLLVVGAFGVLVLGTILAGTKLGSTLQMVLGGLVALLLVVTAWLAWDSSQAPKEADTMELAAAS